MSSDIARGVIASLRKEVDFLKWAREMTKKYWFRQIAENNRLRAENKFLKNELKRHAKNRRRA